MKKDELLYIIGDYCSHWEIDITEEELLDAADLIAERIEDEEEYNYRCGIYSTSVDLILDSYFSEW